MVMGPESDPAASGKLRRASQTGRSWESLVPPKRAFQTLEGRCLVPLGQTSSELAELGSLGERSQSPGQRGNLRELDLDFCSTFLKLVFPCVS